MAANSDGTPKRRRGPGRPFQKGQSGNPNGRPKRDNAIIEFLTAKVGSSDTTRREMLLLSLNRIANDPRHRDQLRAIELLLAYDQGRPTEKMEMSGPEGGPIKHATGDLDGMTSGELRKELAALEAAAQARRAGTDGSRTK